MAQYQINRHGAMVGLFPEEDMSQALLRGTVQPTDLCWKEGMAEWLAVSEVVPLPPGMPPPLPYAPPLAGPPLPYPQQQKRMGDDAGMRMLMPVGRSGWAIAAGYLGLFSVTLVAAPLALICAYLGMREINKSKNTPNPKFGMGRVIFGYIMGTAGTLVLLYALFFARRR